jgi:hypothetical protein
MCDVDMQYSVVAGDFQTANRLRTYSLAYANNALLTRSEEFGWVPRAVEDHLAGHISEFARSRVFVHAGVVGWKDRAVLIPGRSHAGKSSLVGALLRAGATYYSDEFAPLDQFGRVHPYPSPIHIRNGDRSVQRVSPRDFPATVGTKPLLVGLILVTQYDKGAVWRPRRISQGEGVLALLTNTASARRNPKRALKTFSATVVGARILKGPRGEADVTVARLLRTDHLPG